jgi:hypothetical protein
MVHLYIISAKAGMTIIYDCIMTYTHSVPKRSKSAIHFHFRSKILKDLISDFKEIKQFQILLNSVRNCETLLVSLRLKSIVQ